MVVSQSRPEALVRGPQFHVGTPKSFTPGQVKAALRKQGGYQNEYFKEGTLSQYRVVRDTRVYWSLRPNPYREGTLKHEFYALGQQALALELKEQGERNS